MDQITQYTNRKQTNPSEKHQNNKIKKHLKKCMNSTKIVLNTTFLKKKMIKKLKNWIEKNPQKY